MNRGRYKDKSIDDDRGPRLSGRRPHLTEEQAAEAMERYRLGVKHTPKNIARDFGISTGLLYQLLRGYRPKGWDRP